MRSRAVRWFMTPGATLVGRMRYAQKFAVVGLILTIPLGVIAGAYVHLQREQIAFSSKERVGIAYLAPLSALTGRLVAGRTAATVGADEDAEAGQLMDAAVAAVDTADRAHGAELGANRPWSAARELVRAARTSDGPPSVRVARYDAAVDAVLAMIVRVGDASNLTLDPDLDTYYLMDMVQFRLPVLLDAVTRVTDRSLLPAGTADLRSSAQVELGLTRGVVTSMQTALQHDVRTVAEHTRDDGARRSVTAAGDRLTTAMQTFTTALNTALVAGRADRLDTATGLRLAATVVATSDQAVETLDQLLQQRIDRLTARSLRVVAGAVLAVLLAAYLFMGFYVSVMTPINRIVASLRAVAAGDLTQRVVVQTRDELAFVAEALNETVSRTREATDLLTEQATIDSLTGLPNRVLMLRRLDDARAATGEHGGPGGWVLFVDLDRFKQVNDSFGHESGDEVLREVAYRLRSLASSGVAVGRLAGDEFVIVAGPDLTRDDALHLGALVVQRMGEQIPLGNGRKATVGASVGIAAITSDVPSEELLRRADVAMYEAKKRGRGQSEMYDETLSTVAAGRLQTQNELRDALDSGGLTAYYQPIMDVAQGRTAGFEALVRWDHPERGLLLPGEFVDVAEESGLIVPLGTSMLTTACRQLAQWQSLHPEASDVYVSVNVSPVQLSNPDFVAVVTGVLAETRIAPHCLCLEITETTLMADVERVRRVLVELRTLGVRLAIDDFGVGYSSLAYLSRFPVQTLKLDRSFVSGMVHDPHDAAIVAMLVGLGRSFDLSVVAEGVESAGQRDQLLGLGYATMQGYLFGRPGPAHLQGTRLRSRPDPLTDPFFAVHDVPLLWTPSSTLS